jgi:hypothetical protein
MPPFGRFRFDDCRGIWRRADDLSLIGVMQEFQEIPNLGVCLSSLQPDAWQLLAECARAGRIEVVPHVLKPDVGIYNAPGSTATSRSDPLAHEIASLFAQHDCPIARSVSDHNHEFSERGRAIAAALGMTSRMNVMASGEHWEGLHRRWRPRPFGSMHLALDQFLDAPELFIAINHHSSFSDSFLAMQGDQFLCTSFGGFTNDRWDFLNGNVGPDRKDLDAALDRLLIHTELCLTSLFFCGSITHTHFARHLEPEDWRYLLGGYRAYADPHGYRPAPFDEIAAYGAQLTMRTGIGKEASPSVERFWTLSVEAKDRETWRAPAQRQAA